MSEFLVKMDTPNRCCDCPMCYDYILCRLAGKEFGEIECVEIVADWCPLIKIPPHGRLIDADELPVSTAVPFDHASYEYVSLYNIKIAPTIIEAEEWASND